MKKLRTRHPFPDLTIYADDPAPVEQVRQALELGPEVHPDARERGVELALGFIPHRGENRKTRRAAVATWEQPEDVRTTRRELLKQRKRRDRGTLDVELRRLQRKALSEHGRTSDRVWGTEGVPAHRKG